MRVKTIIIFTTGLIVSYYGFSTFVESAGAFFVAGAGTMTGLLALDSRI